MREFITLTGTELDRLNEGLERTLVSDPADALATSVEVILEGRLAAPFRCETHLCGACGGCRAAKVRDVVTEAEQTKARLQSMVDGVAALHPRVPLLVLQDDCPDAQLPEAQWTHEWDDVDGEPVCRACEPEGYVCETCRGQEGEPTPWPCMTALVVTPPTQEGSG